MNKIFALTTLVMASIGVTAYGDQVCVSYNPDGSCAGWVDSSNGGYTPNYPGVPGNPSNPGSSCTCVSYDANGGCTYYVGC